MDEAPTPMNYARSPRFNRVAAIASLRLTERDRQIIRQVHRHRFLRSSHIQALVGGSRQQILRRLQLLYHHRYLERPRAQLRYYERGASREIAYGLGNEGGKLLAQQSVTVGFGAWSEKNHDIGRVYLEHALFVSDVMVAIELACRTRGDVRSLHEEELGLPVKRGRFRLRVKVKAGKRLGIIPDRVFALEYLDRTGQNHRIYYFLEADRGTMPVLRNNLSQTSFQRKLLAYQAAWSQGLHLRIGIKRFRVLAVTTIPKRVQSLVEACSKLESGQGLFLFGDKSILNGDVLLAPWQAGRAGETTTML